MTTPPTTTALDELERLAIAATDGPWAKANGHFCMVRRERDGLLVAECWGSGTPESSSANAAYIAAANPAVVRGLIAALRAATARADEAERQRDEARAEGWQPMATAPKDGRPIDLWMRRHETGRYERVIGIRYDVRQMAWDYPGARGMAFAWRPIVAPPDALSALPPAAGEVG